MVLGSIHGEQPLMEADHTVLYDNSSSSTPVDTFRDAIGSRSIHEQGAIIPRQFPLICHLYTQPFSRMFQLGEHQESPVYAVSTHSSWSGNPDVVLHTGTSKNDLPLAAAEATPSIPPSLTIHLPSLPGSDQKATIEPLVECKGLSRRYRFSIEVDPAGAVREEFEWRHSSGSAIKDYACARQGWKLMRMSTNPPSGVDFLSSIDYKPSSYKSSDDKEVVAVWANFGMSTNKLWRFAFLGTGATGALGERWAVMAVMTALLMWEQERRARTSVTED